MKTEWDYTKLAKAYLKRADYSQFAIDKMLQIAGISEGEPVCDVGAGVAHLTLMLAAAKLDVSSVEPNDEMRKYGILRTVNLTNVSWSEGVGEKTGQPDNKFKLVTFGSSFNVCDRLAALTEVKRISQRNGWFAAMWNHRDLDDPVQSKIENIIASHVPEYGYGTRREDQTEVIKQSGLFSDIHCFSGQVEHIQKVDEMVEAWRSHATLERQAGSKFLEVVDDIETYLLSLNKQQIVVPYTTNVWMAQLK
jgi:ubiquinone/menaquinone biosynthesis C-methylase UbiE